MHHGGRHYQEQNQNGENFPRKKRRGNLGGKSRAGKSAREKARRRFWGVSVSIPARSWRGSSTQLVWVQRVVVADLMQLRLSHSTPLFSIRRVWGLDLTCAMCVAAESPPWVRGAAGAWKAGPARPHQGGLRSQAYSITYKLNCLLASSAKSFAALW